MDAFLINITNSAIPTPTNPDSNPKHEIHCKNTLFNRYKRGEGVINSNVLTQQTQPFFK